MAKVRSRAVDVAALAGVSRSTVSYIIGGNTSHTFPPETVARVRAAATALAYTPDAAARALRRGRSGVVLLALRHLPWSANLFKLVTALSDTVNEAGLSLVIWSIHPGGRLADTLRDVTPSVILEILPLPEDDRRAADASGIPLITVSESALHLDRAAAALQVGHLAGLGHRRLGVLACARSDLAVFADPRTEGVVRAAAGLGLPEPQVTAVAALDPASVPALARTLAEWAEAGVTGLCCFNDGYAAMALAAAQAAGLRAPEDLSVVGMDDDMLGGLLGPGLTSVRFDFALVADRVRAQLLASLADDQAGQFDWADAAARSVRLMVRGSTAPPGPARPAL
jgi:DNA-binding LacI/PurR family transcriptional regulator